MEYKKTKMSHKRRLTRKMVTFLLAFGISFTGINQIQHAMAQIKEMETAVEPSGEVKFTDFAGKEWAKQAVIFATLKSGEEKEFSGDGTKMTVFALKEDGSRVVLGAMDIVFSEDYKTVVGTFAVTENGTYIVEACVEEAEETAQQCGVIQENTEWQNVKVTQKKEAIQIVDCIDRTPPKVSEMVLEPFVWLEEPVKIVVTATDLLALAEKPYSWDGGVSWSDKNYVWAEEEGVYRVLIKDVLGNISEAVMEAKKWKASDSVKEGEALSEIEETGGEESSQNNEEQENRSKSNSKKSTYQIKVTESIEASSKEVTSQIDNPHTQEKQKQDTTKSGQKPQIEANHNENKNNTDENDRLQIVGEEATIALEEAEELTGDIASEKHRREDEVNHYEKKEIHQTKQNESVKENGEETGKDKKEEKNILERVKEIGTVLVKGTVWALVLAIIPVGIYWGKKKDLVTLYCFEHDKVHKKLGEMKLFKKEDVYVVEIEPQLLLREKGSHYILRIPGWFVKVHEGEAVYISYLQQSFQAEIQREITFSV